jgi:hypothetical protein
MQSAVGISAVYLRRGGRQRRCLQPKMYCARAASRQHSVWPDRYRWNIIDPKLACRTRMATQHRTAPDNLRARSPYNAQHPHGSRSAL